VKAGVERGAGAPGRDAARPSRVLASVALFHAPRLPHSAHAVLAAAIVLGVALGVLTRMLLLAVDEGRFPSRPHGRINYVFLGLVAAVLGALAPAAVLTADYTAGVFLAIGLSQFHQVRQIERAMLRALDAVALVPRGKAYIEGLSMMLETRNYLVMLTAMLATAGGVILGMGGGAAVGVACGLGVTVAARTGASLGGVADVGPAELSVEDGQIRVGGTPVHAETPDLRAALPHAVGLRLRPRGIAARLSLAEPGQRQAVLHNVSANLGFHRSRPCPAGPDGRRDPADGALLPAAAVDPASGDLAVLCFPAVGSADLAAAVARDTPLLETIRHRHPRRAGAPGGAR
jgi:hypothetical protein